MGGQVAVLQQERAADPVPGEPEGVEVVGLLEPLVLDVVLVAAVGQPGADQPRLCLADDQRALDPQVPVHPQVVLQERL